MLYIAVRAGELPLLTRVKFQPGMDLSRMIQMLRGLGFAAELSTYRRRPHVLQCSHRESDLSVADEESIEAM